MKLFHQGCDLGAAISSFWNSGSKLYLNVGSQLTVMKYSWITISNSTSKYSSEYKINFPKKYISLCNSLKKKTTTKLYNCQVHFESRCSN